MERVNVHVRMKIHWLSLSPEENDIIEFSMLQDTDVLRHFEFQLPVFVQ